MASPPSLNIPPQRGPAARTGHPAKPRNGGRLPSPRASTGAPDLAAAAAQAVVSFLHDSTVAVAEREGSRAGVAVAEREGSRAGVAVAEREGSRAGGAVTHAMPATATAAGNAAGTGARDADGVIATAEKAMPWSAASAIGHLSAESVALRAAAVSVSTLDRIELMAAKLEADIASAHRAQAELQAGAGAAAAAAVRAAQAAWVAAGTAVDADRRAKISLLKVARYVEVTVALLIVAMVILIVSATAVR